MPEEKLPEWEELISCVARLQSIIPEAVLVGGTAAIAYADHRHSHDADHVVVDLKNRFDHILATLESVAGWKTARVKRPVLILGSLDGIETGIRQLIREQPLETHQIQIAKQSIVVPTEAEILRIKAVLILKRNATRDYLDFVALASHLGLDLAVKALAKLDILYPQPDGVSALQQLQIQLASPIPYDLDQTKLSQYRNLNVKWHNWQEVVGVCTEVAMKLLDEA